MIPKSAAVMGYWPPAVAPRSDDDPPVPRFCRRCTVALPAPPQTPSRWPPAARRPARDPAEVTETRAFRFGSTKGCRQDACRPLNRPDVGKHGLFCNPERRGVAFSAGLAAASDENHRSRRERQTAESTRACRSQCESGTGPWIGASSETVAASGKQQPGVSAAGRSKGQCPASDPVVVRALFGRETGNDAVGSSAPGIRRCSSVVETAAGRSIQHRALSTRVHPATLCPWRSKPPGGGARLCVFCLSGLSGR